MELRAPKTGFVTARVAAGNRVAAKTVLAVFDTDVEDLEISRLESSIAIVTAFKALLTALDDAPSRKHPALDQAQMEVTLNKRCAILSEAVFKKGLQWVR